MDGFGSLQQELIGLWNLYKEMVIGIVDAHDPHQLRESFKGISEVNLRW